MALAVVNAIPDYPPGPAGRQAQPRRAARPPARASGSISRSRQRGLLIVAGRRRRGRVPVACLAALLALPLLVIERARARCAPTSRRGSFVPAIRAIVALLSRRGRRCSPSASSLRACGSGRTNRIDSLRAPLFVSWQLTRDCDLCLPALLHRFGARASACRTSSTREEALRVAGEIVAQRRALRHAVRRRAAGRAAFLRAGRSARAARRAAQDRDQRPALRCAASPSGSPGCRSARSRSASTATARRSTSASGPAARSPRRTPPAAPCATAGLPLEVTFAPTRLNMHEAGRSSSARARSAPSASIPAG